jgi:hypothetical protein
VNDLASVVIERLGREGISCGPLTAMIARSDKRDRGKVLLYLFEAGGLRPAWVAKIARTELGRTVLGREQEAFQRLAAARPRLLGRRPRLYADAPGIVMVIEAFATGDPLANRFGKPEHDQFALDWLESFQQPVGDSGRHRTERELTRDLEEARGAMGPEPVAPLLFEQALARVRELAPLRLNEVPVHGDFTPSNLLVLSDDECFVTDWEWVREAGWPYEDPWTYLLVAARRSGPASDPDDAVAGTLVGRTNHSKSAARALLNFASRRRDPAPIVPLFALLVLARMASGDQSAWRDKRSERYQHVLRLLEAERERFWEFWDAEAVSRSRERVDDNRQGRVV